MRMLRVPTLAAALLGAGLAAASAGPLPALPRPAASVIDMVAVACGPYGCVRGGFGWRYGPGYGFRRFGGYGYRRFPFRGPGFGGPGFGGRGFGGPGFGGGGMRLRGWR